MTGDTVVKKGLLCLLITLGMGYHYLRSQQA
jgi:hypothetical protein